MDDLIQLGIFVVLLAAGYFSGSRVEKKHYQSLQAREAETVNLPVVTAKNMADQNKIIEKADFACGNVVISTDYFKLVFAGLRNFFGGQISAYESLVDRARREAVLRLKENAKGADLILNLRIETSSITQAGTVEAFAYGTAIYYQK